MFRHHNISVVLCCYFSSLTKTIYYRYCILINYTLLQTQYHVVCYTISASIFRGFPQQKTIEIVMQPGSQTMLKRQRSLPQRGDFDVF